MPEHESACDRVAAQFPQLWLRRYVGGKLRRDPVFRAAYEVFRDSSEPILDIGCGMGLLAFYLRERGCRQPILGLDLDARKIRKGKSIARKRYKGVELRHHDVQEALPAFSGEVALFDVLHYLPLARQSALLAQLAGCVAPAGALLVRDCPSDNGPRYWVTWAAEKFAQIISWNLKSTLHFPSRERIGHAFREIEFQCESRPLWGALPFNNYLFVFRRIGVAGAK